jgi:hypothetical protein
MANNTWLYKHGEVGKILRGTLTVSEAIDWTTQTVTMTAKRTFSADPVIDDAPITLVSPTTGTSQAIEHEVTSEEADSSIVPRNTAGYLLEFKITNVNGDVRYIPENRAVARSYSRLIVQESLE